MTRYDMIEHIGKSYLTSNIESGEYSYVQEAGSKAEFEKAVGHPGCHFNLVLIFLNYIPYFKKILLLFFFKQTFFLKSYI